MSWDCAQIAVLMTVLVGCVPAVEPVDGGSSADSGTWLSGPTQVPGTQAASRVCINELLASNEVSLVLEDGSTPDWIELHNPGDTAVSLQGWSVTDGTAAGTALLDDLEEIPAQGFLVLYADGTTLGGAHLPFALPREGGSVRVDRPDGGADEVRYGQTYPDEVFARTPDCCASDDPTCWGTRFGGTPGSSNSGR